MEEDSEDVPEVQMGEPTDVINILLLNAINMWKRMDRSKEEILAKVHDLWPRVAKSYEEKEPES